MTAAQQLKKQQMDACSHPETLKHVRALRVKPAQAAKTQGIVPPELKRQLMDAVSCAETVAQVGVLKLTGGVVLYLARIREMDRGAIQQKKAAQKQMRRDDFGRQRYG
jgi:hypothetical protein